MPAVWIAALLSSAAGRPGETQSYTTFVRSALGILLACLFVVATIADTVICRDGCTDEAPVAARHAASPCALCQGCRQTVVTVASPPAAHPVAWHAVVIATPADPTLPTTELPPKPA